LNRLSVFNPLFHFEPPNVPDIGDYRAKARTDRQARPVSAEEHWARMG
jgi:hypothetical protein